MTIIESITIVMKQSSRALTSKEVYNQIIEQNLYNFPAKNPAAVVNGMIRRHCEGLDFPSAHRIKYFRIASYSGRTPLYCLLDSTSSDVCPASPTQTTNATSSQMLPEEIIQNAYYNHIRDLQNNLMLQILNNDAYFFEHLIVDLLLKMGYGSGKSSGIVTTPSHDGGIDGIINEDKLGLSKIYLQAKRNNVNTAIGRPAIQSFVGAMEDVEKGVFITTSSFTKDAIQYAERQQQKKLCLVDGSRLLDLMVQYELGISTEAVVKIYSIDKSYFE